MVLITGLAATGPMRATVSASSSLPCDIYESNGTPCVAAYSMDRALYSSYDGPLYQVQRASDGATDDIGLLSTGGYVNAPEQNSFCASTSCTITELFDQSSEGNNLTVEGAGGNGAADHGAPATALPITVDGYQAYGLDIMGHTGYRDDDTHGIAVDGEPEGMYMVASGTHVNPGCCFDFGNAETNNDDNGAGHMDAVNLTTYCGSNSAPCTGNGPWVEADMENGQWMGDGSNSADTGSNSDFVTAMLANNGQTTFELAGGDAQSGSLTTYYDGSLPSAYKPMHQEGAIVLGTGGDNSQSDIGSFFEGVMTQGFPSAATESAVQASIVSADYSQLPAATAGPAVVHDGYSSVYTVDSSNAHLQETYLPAISDSWSTQDLSAKYGTPAVLAGTEPVALTHDGYTSVYTIDASNGDLQETYLPAMGGPWSTQNLSTEFGTPPTDVTPTALYHNGYTSVYTIDASDAHLQETYLPLMGGSWSTQDLSANDGTPAVLAGTSPVAVFHSDYASVYTVDASNDHLQETYLPVMGGPWSTQDLSANYGTPATTVTPAAVVHDGYTSVYTVDASGSHLQETYLPAIGDPWTTQDLSADYGTPAVAAGTEPVALYHTGYTSVYTVDSSTDHLQETYLPAIGDAWTTHDLSAGYGTPATTQTPIALLHPDASGDLTWTSVYTVDASDSHLQETYLPAIGDAWTTQDLSADYGTPPAR
jgi:Alpha-L-arabinofuranosidase B, catalytic